MMAQNFVPFKWQTVLFICGLFNNIVSSSAHSGDGSQWYFLANLNKDSLLQP
jgi:hypothetical protein